MKNIFFSIHLTLKIRNGLLNKYLVKLAKPDVWIKSKL